MEDKLERLSLVEGTRFVPQAPLKFFTHIDMLRESEIPNLQEFVNMILSAEIFEAGDVETNASGYIFFKIFIKNYMLLCSMHMSHCNISINKVRVNPGVRSKIAFIEGKRKTVCTASYGTVLAYEDRGEWGSLPNAKARPHITAYEKANAMLPTEFTRLYRYFDADAKTSLNERAEYFEENFLDAVSKYSAIEYEIEKKKCLEAPGVVYISYKSVKAAGDSNQKYVYEFICPEFNSEDYPPGTEIYIELDTDEKLKRIFGSMVDIQDYDDENKSVTVTFKNQFDEEKLPDAGVMKKNANSCQKRVRDNVVRQFKTGDVKARYMLETFNTPENFPTKGFDKTADTKSIFKSMEERGIKSNKSQKEAIEKGIQTKDIALVLGPPGTGKTTVIVEWILDYIKQNKRILISSKNNKAVDNVFERIAQFKKTEEYKDLGMIRLGNADKIQANVREFMPVNQHDAISKEILTSVNRTKEFISPDRQRVEGLLGRLNELERESDKYFKIKSSLEKKYDTYAKLIDNAKKKHDSLTAVRDEYFAVADRAGMAKIYLEENAKKNTFLRFLHFFATRRIRREYEEGTAASESLRQRYLSEAQQYNKVAQLAFEIKNDSELAELKQSYTAEEKLLREYVDSHNTEFSIKTDIEFTPIADYSFDYNEKNFRSYMMNSQQLRKNIDSFEDTIRGWESIVREKDNAVLSGLLINSAQVVGATCIGINSNPRFLNVDFDVSIIDEAGQIQIHDAIVPVSRSNKTLMLGDHKQIPPMVDQDMREMCQSYNIDTELLEKSFFEYMYSEPRLSDNIKIMLDTQFRMPAEVADILSYQFYGGKYYSADFKKNMPSFCPGVFERPVVIIDTADSGKRFERTEESKYYNGYEAEIIVRILKRLREKGVDIPYEEVGIISPYKRQMEEIRRQVKKGISNLSKDTVESMVATLDSFQGQERDMIIYSCTRSNKRKSIGFLKELRRLNVALSRCKKQIIIIGDFDFLTTCMDTTLDEEEELKNAIAGMDTDDDMPAFDDMPMFDDDGEDDDNDETEERADMSDLDAYEKQLLRDTALTGTTRRFSEFMEYLLKKVQAGSGQYIKSKELNM